MSCVSLLYFVSIFLCKIGDQHWMSFAGFSGSPPCVTVAYWQINMMMMMIIRDTCSLQTVAHCSFVDYGSNADAVSHYSVYFICMSYVATVSVCRIFWNISREFTYIICYTKACSTE